MLFQESPLGCFFLSVVIVAYLTWLIVLFYVINVLDLHRFSLSLRFTLSVFRCFILSGILMFCCLFLLHLECYGSEIGFFTLRHFLPYTPSHIGACFVTTSFSQGFLGSQQFFPEGYRASHYGLKHRSHLSVWIT